MATQTQTPPTSDLPYLKNVVNQLSCICKRLDRIEKYVNKDKDVYLKLRSALPDDDSWIVWGKVIDQQNEPVENLRVSLYDRDCGRIDDHLGTVQTDSSGEFCIVYTTQQFQDWYGDNHPTLYLTVTDLTGHRVFQSDRPIRWRAEHLERFHITAQITPPPLDNLLFSTLYCPRR